MLTAQEHMMLVTRLKCAGGLADLMTRKSVNITLYFLIMISSYPTYTTPSNLIIPLIQSHIHRYKSAARQFLEASLDHCECPDLMSPNNVAIYGGLTALATFDRTELLKQVCRKLSHVKVTQKNLR